MPHVVVKLLAGRSEEQKSLLAAQLLKDVMAILNCVAWRTVSVFRHVDTFGFGVIRQPG